MVRQYSIMILLTCSLCWSAAAQNVNPDADRSGTVSSPHLLIPLTARSAGLASTTTGGVDGMNGLEAAVSNPAGLVLNQGTGVLFSHMQYVADIGVNYFGVAQKLGNNQLGLSVSAWDFGDIPETTELNPEIAPERTWSATYITFGATYARLFTDRIAAGLGAKLVSETMAEDLHAATLAFDAGMTYTVGETGLRFGVSLKNFGGAMRYGGDGLVRQVVVRGEDRERSGTLQAEDFELPSLLNFGVSYTRVVGAASSVTVLGNFRSNANESDQFAAGAELGLMRTVFVRAGYEYQETIDENFFQGWNAGGGLKLDLAGTALSFDYAYRSTDPFDGVHLVTAAVTL